MRLEWDARKARENLRKYGVSFEEAASVFFDPLSVTGADPDHSVGERRLVTFGVSSSGRLLEGCGKRPRPAPTRSRLGSGGFISLHLPSRAR